jgi:hypothetical protein
MSTTNASWTSDTLSDFAVWRRDVSKTDLSRTALSDESPKAIDQQTGIGYFAASALARWVDDAKVETAL